MDAAPRKTRVLVVEDDERLLFAMTEVLQQSGYETRTAGDGQMAIQRLSAGHRPDVIVLDVQMPFVSGLEVLAWMERNDVRIPVVLATQEDEIEAAEVGALVKLVKPFTLEQLLAAVGICLNANADVVHGQG